MPNLKLILIEKINLWNKPFLYYCAQRSVVWVCCRCIAVA
jgi:hypothetical protein